MSYSQQLEDQIDHYLIDNEELVKNKEMGWVGYLLNGNMCFGIYDDLLIVRMDPSVSTPLLEKPGIRPFEQDDETPGTIIAVEERIYSHHEAFRKFIDHSIQYTAGLPPKNDAERGR